MNLVTIFIPLYNKDKYIHRALDSIFMQDVNFHKVCMICLMEFILVWVV
jgi:glycosyltransferase involved in cell wall biosynthesis